MILKDIKIILISIGLIVIILFASLTLYNMIDIQQEKKYSELYILDTNQMAWDYPFNIVTNHDYYIYLNVENHMKSSVYYILYVNFYNVNYELSNSTIAIPTYDSFLYEYDFVIKDNERWQKLFTFSITNATITGNASYINTIKINNVSFNISESSLWNSNSNTYDYQLKFGLFFYNSTSNLISFTNQIVNLALNLTSVI